MRQLKKNVVNVTNAELYVLEKTGKNGMTLYGITATHTVSIPAYDSNCIKGAGVHITYQTTSAEINALIEHASQYFSEWGVCSFTFYDKNGQKEIIPTYYHLQGKCRQK